MWKHILVWRRGEKTSVLLRGLCPRLDKISGCLQRTINQREAATLEHTTLEHAARNTRTHNNRTRNTGTHNTRTRNTQHWNTEYSWTLQSAGLIVQNWTTVGLCAANHSQIQSEHFHHSAIQFTVAQYEWSALSKSRVMLSGGRCM